MHLPWMMTCLVACTLAQTPTQPPAKPVERTERSDLDFAAEPLRIESVGMTMRVPLGTEITTTQAGAVVRATLRDAKRNWIINVETPRTENPKVTVEQAAQKTLMDRLMADKIIDKESGKEVGSMGKVIDQVHNLKVPGCPVAGERFYVSLPQGPKDRLVQGYTLFKVSANQFIAFELICAEALLPAGRKAYESAIATLQVEDPEALDSQRRDLITAGNAFFSRLGPGDYEAATQQPTQLYRLFVPAASGSPADAEERGYRTLRFFKGTRAQIDPKATDTRPGTANPAGYLAEVRARLLDKLPTGDWGVTDIEGLYFVSENRKEEAWSLKMVRMDKSLRAPRDAKDGRDAKGPLVFTETGTRSGTNMTVIVNKPGKMEPTTKPSVPPDGYVSQVEVFMLPRLLVASGVEAELGTYAYNWVTENVTLRRDVISQEPSMPGVWKLSTRTREGAEPMTYLYRSNGELIRAELNDGMVMEPVWPDELQRLWKSKELPTERMALPERPRK